MLHRKQNLNENKLIFNLLTFQYFSTANLHISLCVALDSTIFNSNQFFLGLPKMQKDVHFYLTYLLAKKLKITEEDTEIIAWANQFTDDLTETQLHAIRTQSSILGNWKDRQVQLSVLVPFHFIPGSDSENPWITLENNDRARKLVEQAQKNLYQLGIALHGLQDTFSHHGFSGWQEDVNSCYP